MNATEYAAYIKTPHWRELRGRKINQCGKQCSRCGCKKRIQVHHVNYRNIFDVQLEDLQVLCFWCHAKEHPDKPQPKRPRKRKKFVHKKNGYKLSRSKDNPKVRWMDYSEYQRRREAFG